MPSKYKKGSVDEDRPDLCAYLCVRLCLRFNHVRMASQVHQCRESRIDGMRKSELRRQTCSLLARPVGKYMYFGYHRHRHADTFLHLTLSSIPLINSSQKYEEKKKPSLETTRSFRSWFQTTCTLRRRASRRRWAYVARGKRMMRGSLPNVDATLHYYYYYFFPFPFLPISHASTFLPPLHNARMGQVKKDDDTGRVSVLVDGPPMCCKFRGKLARLPVSGRGLSSLSLCTGFLQSICEDIWIHAHVISDNPWTLMTAPELSSSCTPLSPPPPPPPLTLVSPLNIIR
ncbi:hypothetical protein IF1G_08032 [Cordyceps javanica]|uniref:Uncharacterized protein n=1 Tax=Cordyceps javanica TaxID=43265 RepID=A0A545UVG0_9HYPO|nr:hypothetical protein IF1G_08032 [Cordyceps javanica]